MIFLTVGTQLPFDRLVSAVDGWIGRRQASGHAPAVTIESPGVMTDAFAQIGPSNLRPEHMRFASFVPPPEFNRRVADASLVVGHAGMGTIIGSLQHGKPVIIMPRDASRGEHRNDHQIATAERFRGRAGITAALDEIELVEALDEWIESRVMDARPNGSAGGAPLHPHAAPELIDTLRRFIHAESNT